MFHRPDRDEREARGTAIWNQIKWSGGVLQRFTGTQMQMNHVKQGNKESFVGTHRVHTPRMNYNTAVVPTLDKAGGWWCLLLLGSGV